MQEENRVIMRLLTVGLIAVALTLLVAGTSRTESGPEFRFGFKAFANQIPDVVGAPLENEHFDSVAGVMLQKTTTGVMTWSKADNQVSFTDGGRTWIQGPSGVQLQADEVEVSEEAPPVSATEPASSNTSDPPAASGSASSDESTAAPGAVSTTPGVTDPTAASGSEGSASAAALQPGPAASSGSVLNNNLIVSWYGNPNTGLMGVLGQYEGADLARRLQRQANAYAPLTSKNVLPAYELIAVVAQGSAGADGLWRRRETKEIMDSVLQEARANGFVVIMDVQVGFSTVQDELEWLRPYLEQPEVYLALDPEFDMWKGQVVGEYIGHTTASEVNYAIRFLENIIRAKNLPPKVLIVHQFTQNMLPDKENIIHSSLVDVVLDMDGFGNQSLKLGTWRMVMEKPLQFAGIKLFYDQDPGMFTPAEVMDLEPVPSVVIYQ